ncbi:hypothetical protein ABI_06370 [Asticcacaulis biprosthecium C19]|uniref:Uncharacterized protein n=1 Tax=Asticcacaulis biprosthecium C19 TaxID=715226 RepID=F4QKY1_9CAUL|nr:hypothetical protein [Asticcacaulis biprosthecium]EGF92204.1 hypothetical protein ABI_06370 [Asticcacaulis biprosthecium C19]
MYIDQGFILSAYQPRRTKLAFEDAPNPTANVTMAPLARGMSNEKYLALKKADDHQKELQSKVGKVFDNEQMKAHTERKNRVRQKLEKLMEHLKILRKLFSGNPKEMARALTQVFKDLKAALKEFKDATKGQMDLSFSASAAVVPPPTDSAAQSDVKDGDTDADKADAETEATAETAEPEAESVPASASATTEDPNATVTHDELVGAVRREIGQDGLKFLKELKAILAHIEEKMLQPARLQKAAQKPDKDMDKVFEAMDEELKELLKEMKDMERDLKQGVAETGTVLDIAV